MKYPAIALLGMAAIACTSGPAFHGGPSPADTPSGSSSSPAISSSSAAAPAPSTTPAQVAELPFPRCDDVHELVAPAAWYRDLPAPPPRTNPEVTAVRAWAGSQPGFEQLWVDRETHDGWISLGFSRDAEARQSQLVDKFPDKAVVVVPVVRTEAELTSLADRARKVLAEAGAENIGIGALTYRGIVEVDLTYLDPDLVGALGQNFAGQPLCVSGADAALMPSEGPQPKAGDGWRLLADEDGTGRSYQTGIAADLKAYTALWETVGLTGDRPSVDFMREVVIWFGAVHGSGCPRLRLDDVVVEPNRPLVHGKITELDYGICTADAIPHAYVVALDRSKLPHGPFAIQLAADDPPAGVPEERTVVGVDLSMPGATADPSEIHSGGAIP